MTDLNRQPFVICSRESEHGDVCMRNGAVKPAPHNIVPDLVATLFRSKTGRCQSFRESPPVNGFSTNEEAGEVDKERARHIDKSGECSDGRNSRLPFAPSSVNGKVCHQRQQDGKVVEVVGVLSKAKSGGPTIGIAYPQQKVLPLKKVPAYQGPPVNGSYRFHVPRIPEREAELQKEDIRYRQCANGAALHSTKVSSNGACFLEQPMQQHIQQQQQQQQQPPASSCDNDFLSIVLSSALDGRFQQPRQIVDSDSGGGSPSYPHFSWNPAAGSVENSGHSDSSQLFVHKSIPAITGAHSYYSIPYVCNRQHPSGTAKNVQTAPHSASKCTEGVYNEYGNLTLACPISAFPSTTESLYHHTNASQSSILSHPTPEQAHTWPIHLHPTAAFGQMHHNVQDVTQCVSLASTSVPAEQNNVYSVPLVTTGKSLIPTQPQQVATILPDLNSGQPLISSKTPTGNLAHLSPWEVLESLSLSTDQPSYDEFCSGDRGLSYPVDGDFFSAGSMPGTAAPSLSHEFQGSVETHGGVMLSKPNWQQTFHSPVTPTQNRIKLPRQLGQQLITLSIPTAKDLPCGTFRQEGNVCSDLNKHNSSLGNLHKPLRAVGAGKDDATSVSFSASEGLTKLLSPLPQVEACFIPTLSTWSECPTSSSSPFQPSNDSSSTFLSSNVPCSVAEDAIGSSYTDVDNHCMPEIPGNLTATPALDISTQAFLHDFSSTNLYGLDVFLTCKQCDQNFNDIPSLLHHRQTCSIHHQPFGPLFTENCFETSKDPEDTSSAKVESQKHVSKYGAVDCSLPRPGKEEHSSGLGQHETIVLAAPGLDVEDVAQLESLIVETLNGLESPTDDTELDSSFIEAFTVDEMPMSKSPTSMKTNSVGKPTNMQPPGKEVLHEFCDMSHAKSNGTERAKHQTRPPENSQITCGRNVSNRSKGKDMQQLYNENKRKKRSLGRMSKPATPLFAQFPQRKKSGAQKTHISTGRPKKLVDNSKTSAAVNNSTAGRNASAESQQPSAASNNVAAHEDKLEKHIFHAQKHIMHSAQKTALQNGKKFKVTDGKAVSGRLNKELIHKIVLQKNRFYKLKSKPTRSASDKFKLVLNISKSVAEKHAFSEYEYFSDSETKEDSRHASCKPFHSKESGTLSAAQGMVNKLKIKKETDKPQTPLTSAWTDNFKQESKAKSNAQTGDLKEMSENRDWYKHRLSRLCNVKRDTAEDFLKQQRNKVNTPRKNEHLKRDIQKCDSNNGTEHRVQAAVIQQPRRGRPTRCMSALLAANVPHSRKQKSLCHNKTSTENLLGAPSILETRTDDNLKAEKQFSAMATACLEENKESSAGITVFRVENSHRESSTDAIKSHKTKRQQELDKAKLHDHAGAARSETVNVSLCVNGKSADTTSDGEHVLSAQISLFPTLKNTSDSENSCVSALGGESKNMQSDVVSSTETGVDSTLNENPLMKDDLARSFLDETVQSETVKIKAHFDATNILQSLELDEQEENNHAHFTAQDDFSDGCEKTHSIMVDKGCEGQALDVTINKEDNGWTLLDDITGMFLNKIESDPELELHMNLGAPGLQNKQSLDFLSDLSCQDMQCKDAAADINQKYSDNVAKETLLINFEEITGKEEDKDQLLDSTVKAFCEERCQKNESILKQSMPDFQGDGNMTITINSNSCALEYDFWSSELSGLSPPFTVEDHHDGRLNVLEKFLPCSEEILFEKNPHFERGCDIALGKCQDLPKEVVNLVMHDTSGSREKEQPVEDMEGKSNGTLPVFSQMFSECFEAEMKTIRTHSALGPAEANSNDPSSTDLYIEISDEDPMKSENSTTDTSMLEVEPNRQSFMIGYVKEETRLAADVKIAATRNEVCEVYRTMSEASSKEDIVQNSIGTSEGCDSIPSPAFFINSPAVKNALDKDMSDCFGGVDVLGEENCKHHKDAFSSMMTEDESDNSLLQCLHSNLSDAISHVEWNLKNDFKDASSDHTPSLVGISSNSTDILKFENFKLDHESSLYDSPQAEGINEKMCMTVDAEENVKWNLTSDDQPLFEMQFTGQDETISEHLATESHADAYGTPFQDYQVSEDLQKRDNMTTDLASLMMDFSPVMEEDSDDIVISEPKNEKDPKLTATVLLSPCEDCPETSIMPFGIKTDSNVLKICIQEEIGANVSCTNLDKCKSQDEGESLSSPVDVPDAKTSGLHDVPKECDLNLIHLQNEKCSSTANTQLCDEPDKGLKSKNDSNISTGHVGASDIEQGMCDVNLQNNLKCDEDIISYSEAPLTAKRNGSHGYQEMQAMEFFSIFDKKVSLENVESLKELHNAELTDNTHSGVNQNKRELPLENTINISRGLCRKKGSEATLEHFNKVIDEVCLHLPTVPPALAILTPLHSHEGTACSGTSDFVFSDKQPQHLDEDNDAKQNPGIFQDCGNITEEIYPPGSAETENVHADVGNSLDDAERKRNSFETTSTDKRFSRIARSPETQVKNGVTWFASSRDLLECDLCNSRFKTSVAVKRHKAKKHSSLSDVYAHAGSTHEQNAAVKDCAIISDEPCAGMNNCSKVSEEPYAGLRDCIVISEERCAAMTRHASISQEPCAGTSDCTNISKEPCTGTKDCIIISDEAYAGTRDNASISLEPCAGMRDHTSTYEEPCTAMGNYTSMYEEPCVGMRGHASTPEEPCTGITDCTKISEESCTGIRDCIIISKEPYAGTGNNASIYEEVCAGMSDCTNISDEPCAGVRDCIIISEEADEGRRDHASISEEPCAGMSDCTNLSEEPHAGLRDCIIISEEPDTDRRDHTSISEEPCAGMSDCTNLSDEPHAGIRDCIIISEELDTDRRDHASISEEPCAGMSNCTNFSEEPCADIRDCIMINEEPDTGRRDHASISEEPCAVMRGHTSISEEPCAGMNNCTNFSEEPCADIRDCIMINEEPDTSGTRGHVDISKEPCAAVMRGHASISEEPCASMSNCTNFSEEPCADIRDCIMINEEPDTGRRDHASISEEPCAVMGGHTSISEEPCAGMSNCTNFSEEPCADIRDCIMINEEPDTTGTRGHVDISKEPCAAVMRGFASISEEPCASMSNCTNFSEEPCTDIRDCIMINEEPDTTGTRGHVDISKEPCAAVMRGHASISEEPCAGMSNCTNFSEEPCADIRDCIMINEEPDTDRRDHASISEEPCAGMSNCTNFSEEPCADIRDCIMINEEPDTGRRDHASISEEPCAVMRGHASISEEPCAGMSNCTNFSEEPCADIRDCIMINEEPDTDRRDHASISEELCAVMRGHASISEEPCAGMSNCTNFSEEPCADIRDCIMINEEPDTGRRDHASISEEPCAVMRGHASISEEPCAGMSNCTNFSEETSAGIRDYIIISEEPNPGRRGHASISEEPCAGMSDCTNVSEEQRTGIRDCIVISEKTDAGTRDHASISEEPCAAIRCHVNISEEPCASMSDCTNVSEEPRTGIRDCIIISEEPGAGTRNHASISEEPCAGTMDFPSITDDSHTYVREPCERQVFKSAAAVALMPYGTFMEKELTKENAATNFNMLEANDFWKLHGEGGDDYSNKGHDEQLQQQVISSIGGNSRPAAAYDVGCINIKVKPTSAATNGIQGTKHEENHDVYKTRKDVSDPESEKINRSPNVKEYGTKAPALEGKDNLPYDAGDKVDNQFVPTENHIFPHSTAIKENGKAVLRSSPSSAQNTDRHANFESMEQTTFGKTVDNSSLEVESCHDVTSLETSTKEETAVEDIPELAVMPLIEPPLLELSEDPFTEVIQRHLDMFSVHADTVKAATLDRDGEKQIKNDFEENGLPNSRELDFCDLSMATRDKQTAASSYTDSGPFMEYMDTIGKERKFAFNLSTEMVASDAKEETHEMKAKTKLTMSPEGHSLEAIPDESILPNGKPNRISFDHRTRSKSKRYKCKVCFQWFLTLGELDFHKLSHVPVPPPTCYMCVQRRFSSRGQLREHLREKHGKGTVTAWTCGMCLREISDIWMYNEHLREHAAKFSRNGQVHEMAMLVHVTCGGDMVALGNGKSSTNREEQGVTESVEKTECEAGKEEWDGIGDRKEKYVYEASSAKKDEETFLNVNEIQDPQSITTLDDSIAGNQVSQPINGSSECRLVKKSLDNQVRETKAEAEAESKQDSASTNVFVSSAVEFEAHVMTPSIDPVPQALGMHSDCKDPSRDCHHCGKQFPKPFKLQRHLVVHSFQRVHLCPVCPMLCLEGSDLRAHLKFQHGNEDEAEWRPIALYNCEQCADVMHVIKKSFICSTCNYTFSKKEQYDRHMEKHIPASGTKRRHRPAKRPKEPNSSNTFSPSKASNDFPSLDERNPKENCTSAGNTSFSARQEDPLQISTFLKHKTAESLDVVDKLKDSKYVSNPSNKAARDLANGESQGGVLLEKQVDCHLDQLSTSVSTNDVITPSSVLPPKKQIANETTKPARGMNRQLEIESALTTEAQPLWNCGRLCLTNDVYYSLSNQAVTFTETHNVLDSPMAACNKDVLEDRKPVGISVFTVESQGGESNRSQTKKAFKRTMNDVLLPKAECVMNTKVSTTNNKMKLPKAAKGSKTSHIVKSARIGIAQRQSVGDLEVKKRFEAQSCSTKESRGFSNRPDCAKKICLSSFSSLQQEDVAGIRTKPPTSGSCNSAKSQRDFLNQMFGHRMSTFKIPLRK